MLYNTGSVGTQSSISNNSALWMQLAQYLAGDKFGSQAGGMPSVGTAGNLNEYPNGFGAGLSDSTVGWTQPSANYYGQPLGTSVKNDY